MFGCGQVCFIYACFGYSSRNIFSILLMIAFWSRSPKRLNKMSRDFDITHLLSFLVVPLLDLLSLALTSILTSFVAGNNEGL